MTAFVTGAPKKRSALRLSWRRMSAEISGGVNVFVAQLDAEHFAGLQVFGEAEGEELQFFLNVFNPASHEAFDRVDGALGRFGEIFARGIADDGLIVLVERDDRRDEIRAIVAGDYDRALPLHEGHERIRGAQVDADDAISRTFVIL